MIWIIAESAVRIPAQGGSRLLQLDPQPTTKFFPQQNVLRSLRCPTARVLLNPSKPNLVAHRMFAPNLHVKLAARSRRIAVPESGPEVMDSLGDCLVQGIRIDLNLVPDSLDPRNSRGKVPQKQLRISLYVSPKMIFSAMCAGGLHAFSTKPTPAARRLQVYRHSGNTGSNKEDGPSGPVTCPYGPVLTPLESAPPVPWKTHDSTRPAIT